MVTMIHAIDSDNLNGDVRIVDSHIHVWSNDTLEYPFGPHDGLAVPTQEASIDDYLAMPGTAERDVVLIQPRVYGYDHAYLYECSETLDSRIRVLPSLGVARLGAVSELRRFAAHPLTAGFRVVALGKHPASWLCGPGAHLVWDAAAQLAMPVDFLVDVEQLRMVDRIASDHPDLVMIIDHLGRCQSGLQGEFGPALIELAKRDNVYVKLSAIDTLSVEKFPFTDMWPTVRMLFEEFGPSRLMWGSDWPHIRDGIAYDQCHIPICEALTEASELDLHKIFNRTATRLFGFHSIYKQGKEL